MKRQFTSLALLFCAVLILFTLLPVTAHAETEGDWEYSVSSGLATVTKYNGTDAVVTIPDSFGYYQVTSVGKSAFAGNAAMTEIVFPKSLTSIGEKAFEGCVGLTEITLPAKLTSLGNYAFQNCTRLTKITVESTNLADISTGYKFYGQPFYNAGTAGDGIEVIFADGVTRVPAHMFYAYGGAESAANVTSVVMADSITEVSANAFRGCAYLKSVDFGSVVTIGSEAFRDCTALTDFVWSDKLTTIGTSAFLGCTKLAALALPKSLTTIGNTAFSGCVALAEVAFPKSLTTIGEKAFEGCVSLTEITLPERLTSLGSYAFLSCTKLNKVTFRCTNLADIATGYKFYGQPFHSAGTAGDGIEVIFADGVTRVPAHLFYAYDGSESAANVTSVTLADSVTEVSANAFRGCAYLKSVDFGSVVTIGSEAFRDCTALTDFVWSDKLTTIGTSAFLGCTKLAALALPKSLTTIGNTAFSGCSALADVAFPTSLTTIGEKAFESCTSLTEITLPEKLTSLGSYAFLSCTQLNKITFNCTKLGDIATGYKFYGQPFHSAGTAGDGIEVIFADGVTTVPAHLFYAYDGADSAANVTSVTMADSVTYVGENAFRTCSYLESVSLGNGMETVGKAAFQDCAKLTKIDFGTSVTTLDNDAFAGCTALTMLNLPESLTTIGTYTFSGCSVLKDISFPTSLTTIGEGAFKDCVAIVELTLPEKLASLGAYAFQGCTQLDKITFNCTKLGDIATGYKFYGQPFHSAGTAGDGIEVIFADGCTRVPAHLFYAYSGADSAANVTSVTLADTVTYVGENAFRNSAYLETVDTGNGVTAIAATAFQDCTKLTDLTLGSALTSIGNYAFYSCTALEEVSLPASLTTIGEGSFAGCSAITGLVLPEKLATLGTKAFQGCAQLAKITFKCTSLADIATGYNFVAQPFYGVGTTSGSIEVIFADGCTRIPANLFYAYSGVDTAATITSVTVADTVTEVGGNAFTNCGDLKTIKFLGENPTIADNSFTGVVCDGYHPGWPEEALLDYGGDINWIGYVPEDTTCEHPETKTENAKDAACTEEGYTGDTVCTACGETLEVGEPIPPLGHTQVIDEAVAPTCEKTGLTEGKHCSVCGEVLAEREEVAKLPHNFENGICTECGEKDPDWVEPECPHAETEVKNAKEATCTEDGYTGDTVCTECGETVKKGETIPAKGHSYEDGSCAECGEKDPDWVEPSEPSDPSEPDEDPFAGLDVVRIAGPNRFETAFEVADAMKENLGVKKFDAIIVASGTNFPDALSGSYLAAVKSAPILLSFNEDYNDRAKNYIRENLSADGIVYLLGSTDVVDATFEEDLSGYNVKRLAGANRFDTNLEILKEAGVEGKEILVCSGVGFADSLSASATELPILLVYNDLYDNQKEFLAEYAAGSNFCIIGGENAVSAELQMQISTYGPARRVGGGNRFETSVLIAEEFFVNPDSTILAYAWNYPDGLCGGALASTMDAPLILTMTKFESAAAEYVQGQGLTKGAVLGGTGLISDESVLKIFAAE